MPTKPYNRILDEHLHILIAQGNHEAYERLKKRYRYHSLNLCHDILLQYSKTGITVNDLMTVCDGCFLSIVRRFDPSLNSFFSFWKEITIHQIMEYLVDNSYNACGGIFRGSISIDQDFEDKHPFSDVISEKDDDRLKRRKIFEIKNIIANREDLFTSTESTVLNLVLEGYTLAELEHGGMMSRSALYLTFNSAITKLQKIIKRIRGNKF